MAKQKGGIGRYAMLGALVASTLMVTPACSRDKGWPLDTVAHVDVSRYAGTWYEIASYPHLFQRGCHDTQAVYTLGDGGRVGVKNTCHISNRDVTIAGYAEVSDPNFPGRLAVHLKVPVVGETRGEYYIIALDPDYQWAVVGHPNRQYLWILSRKPSLSAKVLGGLLPALETTAQYKHVRKKLRCTPQSAGDVTSCETAIAQ